MTQDSSASGGIRIDVALATYNGAAYIAAFLDSLVRQTCQNFRLVVADDDSTDDTLSIIGQFASRLRIRVVEGGGRLGVVGNFARALTSCDARYVALADQDDIWHPEKLQRLLDQIVVTERTTGPDTPVLVFSDLALVDDDLRPIAASFFSQTLKSPEAVDPRDFALSNHVPGCSTMMNRPLLQLVLPFPDVRVHDWWINLVAATTGRVVSVPDALVNYRQHASNSYGIGRAALGFWGKCRAFLRYPADNANARLERLRRDAGDASRQFAMLRERTKGRARDQVIQRQLERLYGGGRLKILWQLLGARLGVRWFDAIAMVYLLDAERRKAP